MGSSICTQFTLRALNAVKNSAVTSAPVAVAAPVVEAKTETADEDFAQAAPVPLACSIDNPDCEACQ